jgi:hypothetical protein
LLAIELLSDRRAGVGEPAELLIPVLWDAFDDECRDGVDAGGHGRKTGGRELLTELFRRRLRFGLERIVGIHLQHEVNAPFEVETQLDFLAGRNNGKNRKRGDGCNGEKLPAKVLVHS